MRTDRLRGHCHGKQQGCIHTFTRSAPATAQQPSRCHRWITGRPRSGVFAPSGPMCGRQTFSYIKSVSCVAAASRAGLHFQPAMYFSGRYEGGRKPTQPSSYRCHRFRHHLVAERTAAAVLPVAPFIPDKARRNLPVFSCCTILPVGSPACTEIQLPAGNTDAAPPAHKRRRSSALLRFCYPTVFFLPST